MKRIEVRRLVVIESDREVQQLLIDALSSPERMVLGFPTWCAFQSQVKNLGSIHLVIGEIHTDGMSAFEFLETETQKIFKPARVLLLTGLFEQEQGLDRFISEEIQVLFKPFRVQDLRSRVDGLLKLFPMAS